MRLKLDTEIKPREWIYIGALIVITALVTTGHPDMAVQAITAWIRPAAHK